MAKLARLRTIRIRMALTQEELAQRAGVDRSTIIDLEAGREARPSTMRKLADALGVQPWELMGEEEGKETAVA